MEKLKRKINLTKKFKKIKNKKMLTGFKKIKNHDYGSNDKIKNKLKFDKRVKNQNLKLKH
jgi:hypothetical protein